MKVYIAGLNGNMGRRYSAILKHLGHEVWGFDQPDFTGWGHELTQKVLREAEQSHAVVIATPTNTHAQLLSFFRTCSRPLLCEKPISKDLGELKTVLNQLERDHTSFAMVSQYDFLVDEIDEGPTLYNYFKSGPDGLYWDCINIVKHARGKVTLRSDSPVWQCWINGQKLNLGLMDQAYIEMVETWLAGKLKTDFSKVFWAHKKVQDLEAKCRLS